MGFSAFRSAHGDALLYCAISSAVTIVLGWIAINIILKPISVIRDKRIEALQASAPKNRRITGGGTGGAGNPIISVI
jgi:hypothetical protein